MSSSDDIYNSAANNAAQQATNAAQLFTPVGEIFTLLENKNLYPNGNIDLPAWNPSLIQSLGSISITDPPDFTGQYVQPSTPLPSAPDIEQTMLDAYNNANPVTQAALEAAMNAWLTLYSPGYTAAITALQSSISAGLTSGQALSDAVEQRIYNRATQRIEAESRGNQRQVTTALKKRGYELPQGVLSAELNRVFLAASDRNAASATETSIERAKLEIQHKQFSMNVSQQLQTAVQQIMIQYAGIVANLKKFALDYAATVVNATEKTYEAEVKVFTVGIDASLKQFQALVEVNSAKISQYKAKLEGQLEQRRLEYNRMELQLKAAQIPYEGELRANLEEASLAVQSLNSAISAAAQAYDAASQVASAAMASLNSIGSKISNE